jgi:hypothetical protein
MKRISSNVQLYTAAIDRRAILVFLEGELIGNGPIDEITEYVIKIHGERDPRANCRFFLFGFARGERIMPGNRVLAKC